jgi:hypothetical protein
MAYNKVSDQERDRLDKTSPFRNPDMALPPARIIRSKRRRSMGHVVGHLGGQHPVRVKCRHMALSMDADDCRFDCGTKEAEAKAAEAARVKEMSR